MKKNEIYSRKRCCGESLKKWTAGSCLSKKGFLRKIKLQVYANDKNLVTRTQNCQVQLLIENNGIRKSIDVNSPKTIDDNITIAVQKKEKQIANGHSKACRYQAISHNATGYCGESCGERYPIMKWKMIVRNPKDRIFDHRLRTVNRWMPVLEKYT